EVVRIGGPHGRGVVTCRVGTSWSAPAFVSLTPGSDGPQVPLEGSDLVMLVMSARAMSQLFRPTWVVGADASAAAGPTGGEDAGQVGQRANGRPDGDGTSD